MTTANATISHGYGNPDSGNDDTRCVGIQQLLFSYQMNSTFTLVTILTKLLTLSTQYVCKCVQVTCVCRTVLLIVNLCKCLSKLQSQF
jgi:hypothetical protein